MNNLWAVDLANTIAWYAILLPGGLCCDRHAVAPLSVEAMITMALLLAIIGALVVILIGMTILAACLWNAQGDERDEPVRNRRFRNHLDPDLGRDP